MVLSPIGAELRGRTALVTGAGAADGIGFACARQLCHMGATVVLTATSDRVHERAAELRSEGFEASAALADLTDPLQASRLVTDAASSAGLEVVGIVTTGGALGATIEYVLQGAASISFAAAPAATSNGQPVYLSTVAGLGTLTEPTSGAIVRLGFLTGANGADTTPAVWMDTQLIAVLL